MISSGKDTPQTIPNDTFAMQRPEKTEFAPYYETYVSLVPETDIVSALRDQLAEFEEVYSAIAEEKASHAYAEGKWTIKEVAGHLNDCERIFAYRALRIGRGDRTPLAGFDQNPYVENGDFNRVSLADLIEEFRLLRRSSVLFFKNLPEEAWARAGTSSEAQVSVRALAFIMVGHVRHHTVILKERYLV